jgi:cyanophycinase-like exopeptidase
MTHYCALYSMVFMMSFVMVFDSSHQRKRLGRLFSSITLMSQDELSRIQSIWTACQDV